MIYTVLVPIKIKIKLELDRRGGGMYYSSKSHTLFPSIILMSPETPG